MYKEVNTGTNLPAQIDLYSVDGEEYKFLCMAKGGGSANKTYLYQETKALITPAKLKNYLVEKMRTLGTAACPPYHIAFVIGGTSAEATLKTVKLASTRYYDGLPTEGNEHGQAFRDVQLEQELLQEAQNLGLGAQFAREILRSRYPGDPSAAPRRLLPDRHGRLLLRRPQHQSENQPRRHLDREAGEQSGEIYPEHLRQQGEGNVVSINLNQPMSEILGATVGAPGLHAPEPQRHHYRGPRHRPRQAEGAYR